MFKLMFVFLILFPILFINCSNDGPDLGTYYQKSFVDSIYAEMYVDPVHIIVEQFGLVENIKEIIPYDTENNASLNDTIKLILKVNFGSYSPNPNPKKELIIINDTLYLWYASREKPEITNLKKLHSNKNISGIQTSPKLEYYSIEKATIKKSPTKKISFRSILYK